LGEFRPPRTAKRLAELIRQAVHVGSTQQKNLVISVRAVLAVFGVAGRFDDFLFSIRESGIIERIV
jgi:hypothetical protein